MEETDACTVQLGHQGPGRRLPLPLLVSLCRFPALEDRGRMSRGVDPQLVKFLHREAWRGVPCERLEAHSPPLRLVWARRGGGSTILW